MKHFVAIRANWSQIFDRIDLHGLATKRSKRLQMMNVDIPLANLPVCDRKIKSTYAAQCAVGLNANIPVLPVAFIPVDEKCDSVPFLRSSGRRFRFFGWWVPVSAGSGFGGTK